MPRRLLMRAFLLAAYYSAAVCTLQISPLWDNKGSTLLGSLTQSGEKKNKQPGKESAKKKFSAKEREENVVNAWEEKAL